MYIQIKKKISKYVEDCLKNKQMVFEYKRRNKHKQTKKMLGFDIDNDETKKGNTPIFWCESNNIWQNAFRLILVRQTRK
jgi:hypothetical protein